MEAIERFQQAMLRKERHRSQYILDTLLATVAALFVTALIYLFKLYPKIPNISLLYILIVLALASTRGRYPAIIASIIAFLSFDFFLVPPLFKFTISKLDE
ncbi:MAG TPA: DUF4118 domain-containing protein, partial [Ktedonobacteraceae bacterium]|nr:DUF4118 domain-containing protein [Ktedonobacteraceae bacterium]